MILFHWQSSNDKATLATGQVDYVRSMLKHVLPSWMDESK